MRQPQAGLLPAPLQTQKLGEEKVDEQDRADEAAPGKDGDAPSPWRRRSPHEEGADSPLNGEVRAQRDLGESAQDDQDHERRQAGERQFERTEHACCPAP